MKSVLRAIDTGVTKEEREKTRYVIATDGVKVFHAIELKPYLVIATGLKTLEVFDTKESAVKKYPEASFGDLADADPSIIEAQ